jgi:hypothetical protein
MEKAVILINNFAARKTGKNAEMKLKGSPSCLDVRQRNTVHEQHKNVK